MFLDDGWSMDGWSMDGWSMDGWSMDGWIGGWYWEMFRKI
jgi:hypothetical protein